MSPTRQPTIVPTIVMPTFLTQGNRFIIPGLAYYDDSPQGYIQSIIKRAAAFSSSTGIPQGAALTIPYSDTLDLPHVVTELFTDIDCTQYLTVYVIEGPTFDANNPLDSANFRDRGTLQ